MNRGGPGSRRGGNASYRYFNTTNMSKKTKKYLFARLCRYLLKFKWLLICAAVLTVTSNLFALLGPELSGHAIDAIELGEGKVDFSTVFYYAGLMLIFYITSGIMKYVLSVIMIKLSRSVVYQMRKDVFSKLVRLPVGFFDRHQTGEIISTISYDIDTINSSLSNDVLQICTSIITVAGSFLMMLRIAPQLVLIFAVTIPISLIFTRHRAKLVRPLFRDRSKKLGELNGYVEEMISGQKTTKAYGREMVMIDRFDSKNQDAVDAYYKSEYHASITGPAVNFITNMSLTLISVFGSLLYLLGYISLGNISSFVLYSRQFSGPINEIANIISELQSAFAAAERVFRLIDEDPEPTDSKDAIEIADVKGKVSIQNLRFGYEANKPIIKNMNLEVEPGSVVAIVGPTGAGKTTIINLLMRFYDTDEGTILIDGQDIRTFTRDSLRRSYTMVLQDTWLFHGTIYENLAYGKEGVTREDVERVAKAAKIHKYITKLPDGYDTVLVDNAVNISKGQKQLLTIARAMLLDSKMLILDEATSNVDTQTEKRIQSAMLNLMKNKTCFVIAHRLSTIQHANMILVVKDGNIVERGTHDELMQLNGVYHGMYVSQFD